MSGAGTRSTPTDHPRSRGVYCPHTCDRGECAGSSPLARGLQSRRRRLGAGPVDHPRSRGVYPRPDPRERIREGSSPLARGLLIDHPLPDREIGIIPARAGFTPRMTGALTSGPDHPRSRGVYSGSPPTSTETRGSSPLARGLPGRRISPLRPPRIIPARAGFTRFPLPPVRPAPDHPRSRGVYSAAFGAP